MGKILEYFSNLWYSLIRIGREGERMEMNKLTVFDVANFFRSKEEMSHKKLQKLVYYAYAWYIALKNENKDNLENKLFYNCHFEAWIHGPVCPKLYIEYSNNYGQVSKYKGKLDEYGKIENFRKNLSDKNYKKRNHIHPINWKDPQIREKCFTSLDTNLMSQIKDDCWQLGIDNHTFRIHGFFIENVFYIVWLDPLHNLYHKK